MQVLQVEEVTGSTLSKQGADTITKQNSGGDGNETLIADSVSTVNGGFALSMSDLSTSSTALSSMLVGDEPSEVELPETKQLDEKESQGAEAILTDTVASGGQELEPPTGAAELIDTKVNLENLEQANVETSSSIPVQEERIEVEAGTSEREPETKDVEVKPIAEEDMPSTSSVTVVEADSSLVPEAAETALVQGSELQVSEQEEETPTRDDIIIQDESSSLPGGAETSLYITENHDSSEEAPVEEVTVLDVITTVEESASNVELVEPPEIANKQVVEESIVSVEPADEKVLDAELDISDGDMTEYSLLSVEMAESAPQIARDTGVGDVVSSGPSEVEEGFSPPKEAHVETEELSQREESNIGAESTEETGLGIESESLTPLEHAESTASSLSRSEDLSVPVHEEAGSDSEVIPLMSSLSGILTTDVSETVHATESETESREHTLSAGGANPVHEGLRGGSKKKWKKELLARADAAGNTADLYNAYKAPEEKKLEDVKRTEVSGAGPSGSDTKDSVATLEKTDPKELDDWEDAAELPSPNIAVAHAIDTGDRKYTRDFLMTYKDQNRDLPSDFEIRNDLAETLLAPFGSLPDAMPSPGRILDRQPSGGGQRLERRGSGIQQGVDEDRWTRQPGLVPSPGRNQPGDVRMDMGMQGGFRPGQGNIQPGLITQLPSPIWNPQPGFTGLIPRGPANMMLPHFMPPGPPRGNLNGVDADRWHRSPMPGGKGQGLIPSPRTLPAIHKSENRYEVGKVSDEEQTKQRLIKGILNKLTPQNFDKLFEQVHEASIDSATTLTAVISQIFDKALMEPTFCETYAKFCVQLAADLPEFTEDDEKITFKRVLLNKCQEEFERGEREQEEAEKIEEEGEVKLTPEEREEKRLKARRRMLGNIRFIGELYKKSMLTERIMHECIKKLLGDYQNPDEEDVEALCKLMSTIGVIIDHVKAKEHIDAYFKRMENLSNNMKLSSRLRFMLKDVIDLRRNGWLERRKVEGPKKIEEVHRDAVQERQQASANAGRDRLSRGSTMGGGLARGRVGTGQDFGMRGPQSPMFSPGQQMGGGTFS